MNYYYIYIFFDKNDSNKVFYCGRGIGNRPRGHLTQAGVSTVSRPIEGDVLGATGEDVLYVLAHGEKEGPQEGPQNDIAQITKVQKIQQLTKNGTTPAQMIRVIATGLSIELSQTMESFCIHHVYGKERLLNIASGTSKERFRPHGMWDAVKWDGSEESSQKKPYYTYVLRNPDTNEVLYAPVKENLNVALLIFRILTRSQKKKGTRSKQRCRSCWIKDLHKIKL